MHFGPFLAIWRKILKISFFDFFHVSDLGSARSQPAPARWPSSSQVLPGVSFSKSRPLGAKQIFSWEATRGFKAEFRAESIPHSPNNPKNRHTLLKLRVHHNVMVGAGLRPPTPHRNSDAPASGMSPGTGSNRSQRSPTNLKYVPNTPKTHVGHMSCTFPRISGRL